MKDIDEITDKEDVYDEIWNIPGLERISKTDIVALSWTHLFNCFYSEFFLFFVFKIIRFKMWHKLFNRHRRSTPYY